MKRVPRKAAEKCSDYLHTILQTTRKTKGSVSKLSNPPKLKVVKSDLLPNNNEKSEKKSKPSTSVTTRNGTSAVLSKENSNRKQATISVIKPSVSKPSGIKNLKSVLLTDINNICDSRFKNTSVSQSSATRSTRNSKSAVLSNASVYSNPRNKKTPVNQQSVAKPQKLNVIKNVQPDENANSDPPDVYEYLSNSQDNVSQNSSQKQLIQKLKQEKKITIVSKKKAPIKRKAKENIKAWDDKSVNIAVKKMTLRTRVPKKASPVKRGKLY